MLAFHKVSLLVQTRTEEPSLPQKSIMWQQWENIGILGSVAWMLRADAKRT